MANEQSKPNEKHGSHNREWLGYALILVVFAAASIGLLLALNPGSLQLFLAGARRDQGSGPMAISLIHSNDTYGYLQGCG